MNLLEPDTNTQMLMAIVACDAAVTKQLIAMGADPNACEPGGGLPFLVLALRVSATPVVEVLLQAGANPNLRWRYGKSAGDGNEVTALMIAAQARKPEMAKLLLNYGADPKGTDARFGVTAHFMAKSCGWTEMLDVLDPEKPVRHLRLVSAQQVDRVVAMAATQTDKDSKHWSAQAIFARLEESIVGNERYKKSLAVSLSDLLSEPPQRTHLLVHGPSGTGKTHLLEQCLPEFGIPYCVIDGSSLVPAGIVGNRLKDGLEQFFKAHPEAVSRCVIVVDEFDKISEHANGGNTEKSHSIQSELLTLIQGKQEGGIDTRNALWVLVGAFAYCSEMRGTTPGLKKSDLLQYGFKNELLGRITKLTATEKPTTEQVVRRVAKDVLLKSLITDLARQGYVVEFEDEALLKIAIAAQSPTYGMRAIPALVAELKERILFGFSPGGIRVSPGMVEDALRA